ncbi:MAG: CBS domain-containing protein [Anaerolineales bacterium]
MKIILTHEQADFDALASELAAYLLDETYIPVLSRKINRNVRAFLTLYGVELPFVEARDLPNVPVETITLVDTQSLISVRGANAETEVHVVDHHPLRDDLPADWKLTVSGTGANTTIFIDTIRERDIVLNTIQSTLLLLGIYEDTGSLTYTRTTARDLRAAGYLLEQGASLQIANDFLNHPLSPDQWEIYDQLRANTEILNLSGHSVVVASGDAVEMEEELSTVAHKLRDLLDPDALFVLVKTRGGVQLIARSTSDDIDVAQVAAHFGGGGHERAAAGIIKDRKLDDIRQDLLEVLPQYVQPAVTVAQIMSSSPRLLAPETYVSEAAQLMQRFGYEGYPVVKAGKVIGLLTRRAVDRTISHNLNYTAEKVMDAGQYTVQPDDSIEHLQRLMTKSGWGQVPVVHPETGQIIGIVTRTDLLKTLTPRPRIPSRQNLADRLDQALPEPRLELLKAVAEVASEQHTAAYIVGGFVRDLLLERPSLDYDLVVEGDAIELAQALSRKFGGRVTSHSRFGTAKWLLPVALRIGGEQGDHETSEEPAPELPDSLDFVSARTEFYSHPTALPTVERGSIKLDLHRRDFTINTLALRLDGNHYGELHDYWGGLEDLRRGVVRVLHSLSFVDDPTRILRAVRFEQRFDFHIDARTLELLQEALPLLDRVSGDRIRHELNIILLEERVTAVMARLRQLAILHAIHKKLTWDIWLEERFDRLTEPEINAPWSDILGIDRQKNRVQLSYIIWLVRLPKNQARSIAERLKLSAELRRLVLSAISLWQDSESLVGLKPSEITIQLDAIHPLALYAVRLTSEQDAVQSILDQYAADWRKVAPSVDGDDLRSLGIAPGPVYRHILNTLRYSWLDGEIETLEEEIALLDKLTEGLRSEEVLK